MPMAADQIETLIREGIPDARVEIVDLAGDGDHYEARVVAEIFLPGCAVTANAAGVAEPRDADALVEVQALDTGADCVDAADDFMARDDRHASVRQIAIQDVTV